MQMIHKLRNRLFAAAILAGVPFLCARPRSTSKEIIELQTQVQQLLDMVQRLQSTMDGRFGVLHTWQSRLRTTPTR